MHEAPESVSRSGHRRTGANRHTPSDLQFHQNPLTAVDGFTSWHQWQAAYPTLSRTGSLRRRASANASGPHSHQSTGFCACWSRYGDVAEARRLDTLLTLAAGASTAPRPRVIHEGDARRSPATGCQAPGWLAFLHRLLGRLNPARRPRAKPRVTKRKYVKWHVKRAHHAQWPRPDQQATYTLVPP